ncbi:MAG: CehA/McbA family metallohydrolase, partial [Chloroflexota bacterium]
EEIYAHLMGRSVDALRQRWLRTQQELSAPVRRADLHSHTTYSDGAHSVAEMERWRQRYGLDLLGITDHNTLKHADDCRPYPQIYLGEEVTGRHHHVLVHQPPAVLEPEHHLHSEVANIRAAGRLPLVAHPTGWMRHIYDDARIQSVRELDGVFLMEIGNGASNWFTYHDSTDDTAVALWDQLLLARTSVVAVGNSDAHRAANVGLVWNGVVEGSTAPEAIYQALVAGRGFVSNGPAALLWADGEATSVKSLRGAGTVRLRLEVADSAGLAGWRLVADGKTWQEGSVEGQRVFRQEFDAPTSGVRSYRLECVATDGRQAYTNPVRLG